MFKPKFAAIGINRKLLACRVAFVQDYEQQKKVSPPRQVRALRREGSKMGGLLPTSNSMLWGKLTSHEPQQPNCWAWRAGDCCPTQKVTKAAGKVDLPMHGSHPVLVVRTKPPTEMLLFAQVPTHTLESLMVGAV